MSQQSGWYLVGKLLRSLLGLDRAGKGTSSTLKQTSTLKPKSQQAKPRATQSSGGSAGQADDYESSPGQFGAGATRDATAAELRQVKFEYAPNMDRDPDPGEIVWTWVPYVENDGRGKDRPVLIIGRIDAKTVVGCYVSTKQHKGFISLGRGDWNAQGRESFLSPERVLRVTHEGMRREGALVPKDTFVRAVREILAFKGIAR